MVAEKIEEKLCENYYYNFLLSQRPDVHQGAKYTIQELRNYFYLI